MSKASSDAYLKNYLNEQSLAEQMIPTVGRMYREQGVIITVFGRKLMNRQTIDIIKAHRSARKMVDQPLSLTDSNAVLEALQGMDLKDARVDIGRLAHSYAQSSSSSLSNYLQDAVKNSSGKPNLLEKPKDVVLYGFGRIGRILARLMIERTTTGNKLRLRAVVVRSKGDGDLVKRASLLRRDSVHGPFNGSITVDQENNAIIANGNYIQVIYANQPEDIDYTAYDIDDALIVDNTGAFKDEAALSRHLTAKGASKVLLTAPAKGNIKNIVYGVNHDTISDDDRILSAASCTTNAITPMLKVMNDTYGIENGHVETVHAYTNGQNLIDNYHKSDRRGRSAPLNMVLTSTGAAKAVAKALPELDGKLTGNAIRVPTPNVSMAVLKLNLKKAAADADEINELVRNIALDSDLNEQIGWTQSTEVVSTDFVGTPQPGILDSAATQTMGNSCVMYVWYDNEFGYSTQVLRVMREMVGMHVPSIPA